MSAVGTETEGDGPLTIAFDESGNTGPDLLNADQPVFALASVSVSEERAIEVLGGSEGEHHSVRDRNSPIGRRKMSRVLGDLDPGAVRVAVLHKPFMVTTKFVDLVLEPVAAATDLDLYRGGMHVGLSNLFHLTWPQLDPAGFRQLTKLFVSWARSPSPLSSSALALATERMSRHAPDGIDALLRSAGRTLLHHPESLTPAASDISDLDPAGAALMGLLQEWTAAVGSIQVLHDDSAEVQRWLPHIRRLSDRTRYPVEVALWNGSVVRYPLPIEGIAMVGSESSARIQLADLIAGAATICFGSLIKPPKARRRRFTEALRESPLSGWVSDGTVWPNPEFRPEEFAETQTAWPIDRLAAWTN